MALLDSISVGSFTKLLVGNDGLSEEGPFTQVKDVQSIGEIGESANIVEVTEYGVTYMRKLVGSKNADPIDIILNINPSDTQHKKILELYKSSAANYFRIQMTTADGGKGCQITFKAYVTSKSFSNEFDSVRSATFTLTPTEGYGELEDISEAA